METDLGNELGDDADEEIVAPGLGPADRSAPDDGDRVELGNFLWRKQLLTLRE